MTEGRLRKAVDRSIAKAVESGNLDEDKSAAAIEMLRFMADSLDAGENLRNIPPASFLSYCNALGICPDVNEKQAKPKKRAKLATITATSKFAKVEGE